VGQKKPYILFHDITHKKTQIQHFLIFFLIISTGLSTSSEGLNNSLAKSAGELWWCKMMPEMWLTWIFKVQVYRTPVPNVLTSSF